jgi:hypothetical protein
MSIRNSVIKYHSNFIWFFFILIVLINYVAIFQYSLNFWCATKIGEWLISYEEGLVRRGGQLGIYLFFQQKFLIYLLLLSVTQFLFFVTL